MFWKFPLLKIILYGEICFFKYKFWNNLITCMLNIPSEQLLSKIPKLYETESVEASEKLIYLHFFLCNSDWYIAEFDSKDTFFGFVCLNGWKDLAEWGNIPFKELKELKVEQPIVVEDKREVMFLEVEYDEYWMVRKAKDIKLIRERQGW